MKNVARKRVGQYRREMAKAKPESERKTADLKAKVPPAEKEIWDFFCKKKLRTTPSEGVRRACIELMRSNGCEWGVKISLLIICLLAVGCVMHRATLNQAQIASIEKGKTTRAEAIAILGTPSSITTLDTPEGTQTVLVYATTYIPKSQMANAMFGSLATGSPYGAGATPSAQIVNVYIGTNDVVNSIQVTQGGEPPMEHGPSKPVQAGQKGGY